MDPNDFDPIGSSVMREMERMNRLTDEMNWIDRIDRQINPLGHTASMLNPLERATDVNLLERIAREVNPAEYVIAAQDAVSKSIQELAMPLPNLTFSEIAPEESAHFINELRFPIDRIETRLSDF